jgi:ABC-type proline/glycine betaine transport system ATPase subunit
MARGVYLKWYHRAALVEISDRPFVVVSGLPGSGKSTVARAMARMRDV